MARPVGYNQGDPNAFTTYTGGVMQMTLAEGVTATSPNVVLTQMNQVQFCGHFDCGGCGSGTMVARLPENCWPDEVQQLCVPFRHTNGGFFLCRVLINESGYITVYKDFYTGSATFAVDRLYMDSISFDLASIRYGSYNPS